MSVESTSDIRRAQGDRRAKAAYAITLAVVVVAGMLVAYGARRVHAAESSEWYALGKLPDWGGLWLPDRSDKTHPFGKGDPPWTPAAAAQIAELKAADKAGHPHNVYINCLPEGMPSFVIMTLNATEFLFTPGRVTILGESQTARSAPSADLLPTGGPHPADPDPHVQRPFEPSGTGRRGNARRRHGGDLAGDLLAAWPSGGPPERRGYAHRRAHSPYGSRTPPRLGVGNHGAARLDGPLARGAQLSARQRDRKAEIVEASCRQGDFVAKVDEKNNAIFVPIPHEEGGAPLQFEQ